MAGRIKYVSGDGLREYPLDGPSAYLGQALPLRGRSPEYDLGARSIKGATRRATEADCEAYFTDPAAADELRRAVEHDLFAGTPGELVFDGEWRQRAAVVSASAAHASRDRVVQTLTWALLDGCWRRELNHSFYPGGTPSLSGPLDYPYDFLHDFEVPFVSRSLTNPTGTACPVRLTIYGPAAQPAVEIAGNLYALVCDVPAGGYAVIDGGTSPKEAYTVNAQGIREDVFGFTVRDGGLGGGSYAFQPLPPGTWNVSWSRGFGFDITTYEEEGEPPWSTQS